MRKGGKERKGDYTEAKCKIKKVNLNISLPADAFW